MGSELSATGGRESEVSEWPRSKFSASAVRQRKNFGHRNRIIGPYEWVVICARGTGHFFSFGRIEITPKEMIPMKQALAVVEYSDDGPA